VKDLSAITGNPYKRLSSLESELLDAKISKKYISEILHIDKLSKHHKFILSYLILLQKVLISYFLFSNYP